MWSEIIMVQACKVPRVAPLGRPVKLNPIIARKCLQYCGKSTSPICSVEAQNPEEMQRPLPPMSNSSPGMTAKKQRKSKDTHEWR